MNNTTFLGIPYLKVKVDSNSYNKKDIIDTIERNYNKSKYRNNWDNHQLNRSNFHHTNKDENNNQFEVVDYSSLEQTYKNIIETFVNQIDFKSNKVKYEYNVVNYTVCNEGQYMRYHDHIAHCDFFMVHYIQFEKGVHKPTLYKNTHVFSEYLEELRPDMCSLTDNTLNNAWMRREIYIDVEEDDLVLAPASVPHMIPVNSKSDKNRITIITNIRLS